VTTYCSEANLSAFYRAPRTLLNAIAENNASALAKPTTISIAEPRIKAFTARSTVESESLAGRWLMIL
jgi:hypothetical protein